MLCFLVRDLVVVPVLNKLWEILLGVGIMRVFKCFHSIVEGTVRDSIPGGYTNKFQFFEVEINNGITELDGVGI